MLDYQGIAALAAVIETQSFQRAAERLFVTQSAVSQRIKSIENFYGEPVLIRTLPYQATTLGLALLGHFRRILLLEASLQEELLAQEQHQPISIAISRDSLETWFIPVINRLNTLHPSLIKIIADDQEATLEYLQKGSVSSCASTSSKRLSGCKTEFLGYLDYILVASPEFKKKYFSKGDRVSNLIKAPAILFDHKDTLHKDYLSHCFNISDDEVTYHVVPSVAGFKRFVLNGYAHSLIPAIDIQDELQSGALINLFPKKIWEMPVYWHSWAIETRLTKAFNELVCKVAREVLRQK